MISPEVLWTMADAPICGRMHATAAQLLGAAGDTVLTFGAVDYDTASALTASTGAFVIPVSGVYLIKGSIKINAVTTAAAITHRLRIITSAGTNTLWHGAGEYATSGNPGSQYAMCFWLPAGGTLEWVANLLGANSYDTYIGDGTGVNVWASYRLVSRAETGYNPGS